MISHESPEDCHTHDEHLRGFDFTSELALVAERATMLDIAFTEDIEGTKIILASE